MGNVGYACLLIALIVSIYSTIAFAAGAKGKLPKVVASARNALIGISGLVTLSVFILLYAIFTHDFQLEYVASYTSINTSPIYLLSALWAGNSGSLLFWAWLLSLFSLIVILTKQEKYKELMPYAAMILMATECFFLILLIVVMNPFNQLSVIPKDGIALNPMLQNLGMVFHPPVLLAGYVAFAIPFAFAISAMLRGETNDEWLQATRRWTLLAWLLLGVGNIIGAWWAYVELGWGGYWAWDPVENAGLMPWLMATAFLHSSIIQRRKGSFKVWNLVLIILTFCLVMFGTFLTRSGLLSSVHTFNDTGMTPYFSVFIGIAFFGALALLYYRYDELRQDGTESLLSRESAFLLNNLLFAGTAVIIFIGTIFPSIWEAVSGVKISFNPTSVSLVNSPFSKVNGPLFLAIILLAGVCTAMGWKQASLRRLWRSILWPLVAAVVVDILLFITVIKEPVVLIAFFVCAFVLLNIFNEWLKGARLRHHSTGDSYLTAGWNLVRLNSQRYGGYIVHTGIILIAIGVIGSSFYSINKEATLKVGDSLNIKGYTVTYNGMDSSETPDKSIVSANLSIFRSGVLIDKLVSEKYFQKSQEQPVTEVAIRSNLAEDLYIILENWTNNGATADFKVLVNPLVIWIWIGGGVFLLGGLITFWPGRKIPVEAMVKAKTKASAVLGKPEDQAEEDIEKQISRMRAQKGILCPKCGTRNTDNARFCSQCAEKLIRGKKND